MFGVVVPFASAKSTVTPAGTVWTSIAPSAAVGGHAVIDIENLRVSGEDIAGQIIDYAEARVRAKGEGQEAAVVKP